MERSCVVTPRRLMRQSPPPRVSQGYLTVPSATSAPDDIEPAAGKMACKLPPTFPGPTTPHCVDLCDHWNSPCLSGSCPAFITSHFIQRCGLPTDGFLDLEIWSVASIAERVQRTGMPEWPLTRPKPSVLPQVVQGARVRVSLVSAQRFRASRIPRLRAAVPESSTLPALSITTP